MQRAAHLGDVIDIGGGAGDLRAGAFMGGRAPGRLRVGGLEAIDGTPILNANKLTAAVSSYSPGDKLKITVTRGGSTLTLSATLGTRPATTTA